MKERLVGAVVLVGLIVALVPEMLSGPRRPAADGRAFPEGAVRVHTIDLAPPVTPPESVQAEPAPSPDEPAAAQPDAVPAPADASAVEAPGSDPQGGRGASSSGDAAPAQGANGGGPAQAVAASAPTRAGADAALETGWAVQLGSFASQENAERLAVQVRKSGYRAFVSRFESASRVRYRVRVGPEQDRAQADRLARRLERDGRQVSVVSHP